MVVQNAALGDAELFLDEQRRLVYYMANRYRASFERYNCDFSEIVSIGNVGLVKAYQHFDGSKGVKWSTYAAKCIEMELLGALRSLGRKKWNYTLELDIATDEDGKKLRLLDVLQSEDSTWSVDWSDAIERLGKRDRWIVQMRISGYSQKEIAKRLEMSQTQISRIIRRFKESVVS
ncbi:sigma-70 family RNA polymerase sigma factor [Alicyclobacillus tolerans]|uniref:sigma-70 family RNA polymerase sigma factor n=1 Tax=Alicyclobacillus tolerans TaxID=90970 RepID=UPI003B765F42